MAIDDKRINNPNANVPFYKAARLAPLASEFLGNVGDLAGDVGEFLGSSNIAQLRDPLSTLQRIRRVSPSDQTISEELMEGKTAGAVLPPAISDQLKKGGSKGFLTGENFKGFTRDDLDTDLSATDRRVKEIQEKKGIFGPKKSSTVSEPTEEEIGQVKRLEDEEREKQVTADLTNYDDKDKLALDSLLQANAQEGSDEDKKLLNERFIDEYMSAMPAFEGKSKREKGFDLARLGMAIAAGQSPNAIANISKGFLAMGDTFTSDAKDKREYERAIKVSAAKYALDRQKEQREEDRAINLQNIKYNADIKKLSQESSKELRKLLNDNLVSGDISRGDAAKRLGEYDETITNYNSGKATHNMILEIAKLTKGADNKQVLGLKGAFNTFLFRLGAATKGLAGGTGEQAFSTYGAGVTRDKLVKTITLDLAAKILNETGKTISDRDRALVKELVGSVVGKSGITASEEEIERVLTELERKVLRNMKADAAKLDNFEETVKASTLKGTRKVDVRTGLIGEGETLAEPFERAAKRLDATRAEQRQKDIQGLKKISDFGQIKDGKFTPFESEG